MLKLRKRARLAVAAGLTGAMLTLAAPAHAVTTHKGDHHHFCIYLVIIEICW